MSAPPRVIKPVSSSDHLPKVPPPPRGRRLLGGLAVAAYLLVWAFVRYRAQVTLGPLFGHLVDALFLLPIVAVVHAAGPAIGHRRNAWLLLFIPLFNIMVAAGVIYRLVTLPHRPWSGTLLPDEWTRGFRLAVGAGILITVGAIGYSAPLQQWPVERTLDEAVAQKLAASNRSPLNATSRLLMVFDRGDEAVALVHTTSAGEEPMFRAWWFRPESCWWRTGWRLDDDSVAGAEYVVGTPECSDDFHDWCRVGLPKEATGFVMEFENGRSATGVAFDGLGVAFVRPSAPPVRVVAYDRLGQVIADYPVAGYAPGAGGRLHNAPT
ncbi:MAG TPA: hypothetical protein VEU28_04015 [Actinomycetota bacterium]|nr:hypothetical protein [Actinomycetota bacterium]